jgi:importin-5
MFMPALINMLTEVEEDMDTWATTVDEKEIGNTDPYNTAVNALNRLSTDLGEKTILPVCSQFIKLAVSNSDWKFRQAGYMVMGLIAECSKESLMKNMDEAMKLACQGIMDENLRVRYAGLSGLALLLTELSPKAQKKYHAELMPVLMKMMATETMLKVQTHAVSATINFTRGLTTEDDEEEEQGNTGTKIMSMYAQPLFENLVTLLKKGINENYEPL